MKRVYVVRVDDEDGDVDRDSSLRVLKQLGDWRGVEVIEDKHPDRHLIRFDERGWTIAHPIGERLDGSLFDCGAWWSDQDPGMRGTFVLQQLPSLLKPDVTG